MGSPVFMAALPAMRVIGRERRGQCAFVVDGSTFRCGFGFRSHGPRPGPWREVRLG
jgi:hypothetical protein